MRGLLSIASAALSTICAGIAEVLQLFPLPFIGAAKWFDRQARRLSSTQHP